MLRTARNKFALPASWGRTFAVTLVFVTLASGLFWLDLFRSYRAEITVLVVSRAGVPGIAQDVAGDLAALTRTLSFYDRVLADNDLIDDAFAGYAPDKRKALWNDAISVKRQADSGVLIVLAVSDTPEKARRLGRQTAQTMFAVAGFYYDVKTDIDMRIVDGPVAARVLENPALFFVTSILTGLSVTAVFFWLLNMVPGFIGGRSKTADFGKLSAVADTAHPEFEIGETPWIDPRKFVPAKPSELSFGKRAQAPANLPASPNRGEPTAYDEMDLPVADEASLPFQFEERPAAAEPYRGEPEDIEVPFAESMEETLPIQPETLLSFEDQDISAVPEPFQSEPSSSELKRGEPTAEEYKRRLNELLAGGK